MLFLRFADRWFGPTGRARGEHLIALYGLRVRASEIMRFIVRSVYVKYDEKRCTMWRDDEYTVYLTRARFTRLRRPYCLEVVLEGLRDESAPRGLGVVPALPKRGSDKAMRSELR